MNFTNTFQYPPLESKLSPLNPFHTLKSCFFQTLSNNVASSSVGTPSEIFISHCTTVYYLCRLYMTLHHLKTKRTLLYLKTQSVPRSKNFSSRLQLPKSYDVSGTSRCLFSDKYKTHKYSVGRKDNS